ncbi:MAG TPA: extracellular solute-binding protein, partial [Actinomycetota bacterium]|nr:extracellular solute-binding protein [Actinomycetota bacterium]
MTHLRSGRLTRRLAAGAVALALIGCSREEAPTPPGEPSGDLVVLAAASLTDAFEGLAADLKEEHPRLRVQMSFAGSSTLAAQIAEGAPGDVFAAADEATMRRLAGDGDVEGE